MNETDNIEHLVFFTKCVKVVVKQFFALFLRSATGQTKVIFLERLVLLSVSKIGCHNFSISRQFDLKKQQQSSLQAHQRAQLLFHCQTILERKSLVIIFLKKCFETNTKASNHLNRIEYLVEVENFSLSICQISSKETKNEINHPRCILQSLDTLSIGLEWLTRKIQ